MQCPKCREEIMPGAVVCSHCGCALSLPGGAAPADFPALFTAAVNLWKGNLVDLVLLTLVFLLVVWIPIANVGFIAGYVRSLLKVARGQGRARVGDLFDAWDCFGNLFVYLLLLLVALAILNNLPVVGQLASLVVGFVAAPGIYAVIDRRDSAVDAAKWSLATIQADFFGWLLAYLVGNLIGAAGMLLVFAGVLLTLPLGALINLQQYERARLA